MANPQSSWSHRLLAVSVAVLTMVVVAAVGVWIFQPGLFGTLTGTASAQTPSASVDNPPSTAAVPSPVVTTPTPSPTPTPTTPPTPTPNPALLLDELQTAEIITNGFWTRHWADYFPGAYSPPKVLGLYDGNSASVPLCGQTPLSADNAFYCRPADFVAWDKGLMEKGYANGDTWPYLVIAHEWGHAIQARLGDSLTEKASELQADCLAGAALFGAAADGELILETGDQKELAAGLNVLGDETPWTASADHGDSFERIRSFDEGRLHGIARCVPGMKFGGWNGALVYRSGIEVSVSPLGYKNVEGPLPSTAMPTPTGTAAPGSTVRVAAVFEITVKNGSPAAFDATGMGNPIVRYGERGLLAETVPAAATDTPASLGILQPGQTKRIKVSAIIPAGQLTVRVAVPGPNPAVDWAASFEGELPPR
ncbi:neutral zinc metallopeptidase [Arthrobacter sp. TB 26]|uniref:neutral zinc metallopeptidase n=1 Tax=Arthrobacter sp. TB 26 TaxID=494420 RepID=UPI000A02981F|nr:neutral zinc metallopeptidase [Arthrobacter sp. TB 26]